MATEEKKKKGDGGIKLYSLRPLCYFTIFDQQVIPTTIGIGTVQGCL